MKVKAIGVMRMKGISKTTGAPYDFAQVMYLRKLEPVNSEKLTITGAGYEVAKLDLQIESLHKFNDLVFPADLDLTLETIPDRRGVKSVCSGFAAHSIKPAVAA